MAINVKMVRDRILIEQMNGITEVANIQIAEPHIKKIKQGTVVACNESFIHSISGIEEKIPCKVGDIVTYQEFANSRVEYEGKEYICLKVEDLYFIH